MIHFLESNVKSFLYYILVAITCGFINILVWGRGGNEAYSCAVFLLALFLYYSLGFLLNKKKSVYRNMESVLLIPVVSLLLYSATLIPQADFWFEFLYFGTIQPFLTFTGIPANFNHPVIYAFTPALFLWWGLQTKVAFTKSVFRRNKD